MKKYFLIFSLINCLSFAQTQEVAFSDTLANSNSRSFVVDITPDLDSLQISLYAYGEIDIDSLDVKLGIKKGIKYKGNAIAVEYNGTSNSTYSKTLTVDLTNVQESYTVNVVTIPKSALGGYNQILFTLTAGASGNTTSGKQKAMVIVTKYK